MTTANEIWGPARLKFINENPKVLSLLYDLNLLPEVVLTHIRAAREEERKACLAIVHAVHPADGVEGCGCSHEIAKRIKRRGRKGRSSLEK